jgi:S-adenosylmethionine:tRNA ribosyltransferase-isomerase
MKKLFTFATCCVAMVTLNINDYRYDLPGEKIALHPLPDRDQSKLLVYRNGKIEHSHFHQLPGLLPENAFLFFNDTKVIPARLHFKKDTGATIEIFLLSPLTPSPVIAETMNATTTSTWKCTIGNLKRWSPGVTLSKTVDNSTLEAALADRDGIVTFTWTGNKSFAEIINRAGETPLPPYLKRKAETADGERYQTIYSHYEGAVAAPTAGLHFTENVFNALNHRHIGHDFLTLHVSAGTFQPVKTENADAHTMHAEQIVITKKNLDNLLVPGRFIVAVGTTSMRTLESLYWFGAGLLRHTENTAFVVSQTDPYKPYTQLPPPHQAIEAVKAYMEARDLETLTGETSIFIKPGYTFRICKGLVTNFHQPASTLMLLVAAFAGPDWKNIYHAALENDYRFLSFGDSSLLLP